MPQTRVHRLKSVFPPGFNNTPSQSQVHRGHYTYSTEQLYVALVDNYSLMTYADLIIVRSAWYGKQNKPTEHEFILIQVEDVREEHNGGSLVNYLVLDRNALRRNPVDTFRVSYDGDQQRLLNDCNLRSCQFPEQLIFPSDSPLLLYEMVTLTYIASYQCPQFGTGDSGRFWYVGLIWGSLRELRPNATRTQPTERKRGKSRWLSHTTDRPEVLEICKHAEECISLSRARIDSEKAKLEDLIRERISRIEAARTAPPQEVTANQSDLEHFELMAGLEQMDPSALESRSSFPDSWVSRET